LQSKHIHHKNICKTAIISAKVRVAWCYINTKRKKYYKKKQWRPPSKKKKKLKPEEQEGMP
jgi:hypothetical protein